jgi:hypothetical protein
VLVNPPKESGPKKGDGKRAGLSTRDANSKKHPGLADLDEEELKARRKRDRAAIKHQADAKKKKAQQALLEIGTKKLAAHEDQMISQINHDLDAVVRPPPGPVTRKADRPKAPAAKKKNGDDEEDIVPLETDGSRASDSDFAPSENFESESGQLDDEVFMVSCS